MPVETQARPALAPRSPNKTAAPAHDDRAMKKAVADLFARETDARILEHRRQLDFQIEAFKQRQETLITALPRTVRSMTMREFMTKYDGDVKAAIAGQSGRVGAGGLGGIASNCSGRVAGLVAQAQMQKEELNKKRKRVEDDLDALRAAKRSPQKAMAVMREGTPLKTHTDRFISPSPSKKRLIQTPTRQTPSRIQPSRMQSPSRVHDATPRVQVTTPSRVRPPTIATFSPALTLSKTPKYPGSHTLASGSSYQTISGSPNRTLGGSPTRLLAGSPSRIQNDSPNRLNVSAATSPARRVPVKGRIIVHKLDSQPSASTSSATGASLALSSIFAKARDSPSAFAMTPRSASNPAPPSTLRPVATPLTPRRAHSTLALRTSTLGVRIPTIDGHVLELDPLTNSPGDLDRLQGISTRAKQEARKEMGRLVEGAMRKWRVG
ncbi:uncharacterized protein SCHCODRAFT_02609256 [Schizophyllum commune H4-8]|nr:uncharacterized protein SCHCODRAFT_02609256 [Schizophyllum commune H4-8]KAI5897393.1 hypothetical protein SCHCODRAFT_02609256 [Schizophyllum commune H4-8]